MNIDNRSTNYILLGTNNNDIINNYAERVRISALGGNDSINNLGFNVTIYGGDDHDTIKNTSSSVTIEGGAGNDSINNSGNEVSIDAGAGNDTIRNGYNVNEEEDKVTLNGGDGNDYIYNHNDGDVTTIFGGNGNDTIENNGDTISIDAGDGNDYIYSYSNTGTIKGGKGNDTISLSSGRDNLILYTAGDGNDIIAGFKEDSTLQIGNGSDTYSTQKSGNDIIVMVGKEKITLQGAASLSKVNIRGQCRIYVNGNYTNSQSNIVVVGSDSNNYIYNSGSNVMIDGGAGNDSIQNRGSNVTINCGAGDDSVYNMGTANNNIGNNVLVEGGDGNDTLESNGSFITISGGVGNDVIHSSDYDNEFKNISLVGGAGDDTIYNGYNEPIFVKGSSNTTLDGGDGNDYIQNQGDNVTVDGGSGNDVIDNGGSWNVSINGGAGDDSIYNYSGENDIIIGGTGNDTISLASGVKNNLIVYNAGDGNDIITGFKENSTLQIGVGSGSYATQKSGNDIIVSVDNSKITLQGAASLSKLNIVVKNNSNNKTITTTNANEAIMNSGNKVTINALGGNDTIVNSGNNVLFNYKTGDGNDIIINSGFKDNSTLSISGGDYVSTKSGNDVIVFTTDGSRITLQGAARLSKVNIAGKQGVYVDGNYNNSQKNIFIVGSDSTNYIYNTGQKTTILANSGNDSIRNEGGASVKVDGGDGNDTIRSTAPNAYNSTIKGGAGNDYIENVSKYTKIEGGDGNDSIYNPGSFVTIDGGAGEDSIYNRNAYVTIDAGAGNDSIYNTGNEVSINAGAGNDSIYNSNYYVTIEGGAGNDSISNNGSNVKIGGGAGNDYIYNDYYGVTIAGGEGNDSIKNYGWNTSINGGAGNDTILNYYSGSGTEEEINGGAGNDYIYNSGYDVLFKYNAGDGNDTILGFKENSTLQIDVGSNGYVTQRSGNDIIVTVGNGKVLLIDAAKLSKTNIVIKNDASNKTVTASNNNDTIINSGAKVKINALAGNDSITNTGDNVTIDGGAENDTLRNEVSGAPTGGKQVSLNGGAGNDLLLNAGESSTVLGGAGNDNIQNVGANSKLDGGSGNDSIWNHGDNVLFTYNAGDGNDIIINSGFKDNSMLSISGGVHATTTKSGNDIIVTVGNGKITLQGAATLSTVNIVETSWNFNNTKNNTTIYGTNANDTIANTGSQVTIQALRGNDSINNKGAQVIINGEDGNEKITNSGKNVTIAGQNGNDTIANNADSVIISGGAGSDSIYNHASKVTIAGGEGNDTIENDASSNGVTIAGENGNDYIANGGANVTISGGAGNNTISNKGTSTSISTGEGNDIISLQAAYLNTITAGKGSDTIKLDMNTNNAFIQHAMGDGNDFIEGFNSTSTLQIGNGNNTYSRTDSGNDIIITDESGDKITLAGAATLSTIHVNGVTTLNVENTQNQTLINGDRLEDRVANRGSNVTINTFAGNDTISNYGRYVTIDAGADSDSIENNNANYSSISTGDDIDIIKSQSGYRNTINAGKGNDDIYITSSEQALIEYSAGDGNDFVTGFNETSTLQIGDGTGSYYKEIKDDDVIIVVDKDKITLGGAATLSTVNILGDEQIEGRNFRNIESGTISDDGVNIFTVTGTEGDDSIRNSGSNVIIHALDGNDSIHNNNNSVTIDAGNGHDSINNEKNNVSISGGASNDLITVTSSNKVTVNAGTGDDKIYLNKANAALIEYSLGDGNDTITGFKADSTLSIAGGLYSLYTSGNNAIVNVDDEKITLAGAATLSTINIIGTPDKPASNISNSESNSLVTGGNHKDKIKNSGVNVTVIAYGDNDNITNTGANSSIDAGTGNDYIKSFEANYVTIYSGDGDDTVFNTSNYGKTRGIRVSISGGAGNDSIRNYISNSVTLNGGDGDDTLSDYAFYARFIGGKGDDYIYLDKTNKGNGEVVFYNTGDGNDLVTGFDSTSTLQIDGGSGSYSTQKSGNDIIVIVGDGNITLQGAASLSKVNIQGKEIKSALNINNTLSGNSISGTEGNDTISNSGEEVTITALGGNDSITNNGDANNTSIDGGAGDDTIANNYAQEVTITAGAGNDSIYNEGNQNLLEGGAGNDTLSNANGFFSTIEGGAGNDLISVSNSTDVTINGGAGNDSIKLDADSTALIEYGAGDGNDLVEGFNEDSTLQITDKFSTTKSGNDVIVSVGNGKVTLKGAATLSALNISNDDDEDDEDDDTSSYVSYTVANSKVAYATAGVTAYAVANAYSFNQKYSVLNVNSTLEDSAVRVTNAEVSAIKANGIFGTAILSSGNVLEYKQNNVALTSESYGDKITFSQDTTLNYGEIQVELLAGSVISTNGAKEITFDNNSSANITAPEGAKINIKSGTFSINNLPVNSTSGAGTITVESDGLSFEGYGAQFVALQVAKENYSGNSAPMSINYNSADNNYTIQNNACVKTLSNDFTKLTFDISAAEDYANYEVNGKEFIISSVADNINVIEASGNTFKIQDKELDAEKIGRITLDEQITFSGTKIDFDGVKINYALNKPAIYSLDGKTISINDAATLTTGDETKTFKCEAGSYIVNGRTFETTADLTFTADANEIRIPLSDMETEIYFDGVKVSGDSGEIVFDLANDKITIPSGANLNFTSHDDIKLNLAAGSFIIDGKEISSDIELEITANKESLQVPLSENPVTINDAKITGTGTALATIDNTNAIFFSILLPDGALVQNTSGNTFELTGKGSSAYFGDVNKKVVLTDDGTAYIEFDNEKGIGVGFNALIFEHVEIEGVDAWTVETSGTSGIDKITGITDGATITTSTEEIDAGDLRFEVETSGAGEFNICGEKITTTGDETYVVYGNSDGEIKVAPLGEEYADDDSEAAGNVYNFDKAGNHTINGITFHATANAKVQTITRGVEFDLSTGTFQYDGLTLSGTGTAQINRYNTSLISLTDGAIVSSDDKSKYQNRQFLIEGAVEIAGKKFETNSPTRCALLNLEYTIEDFYFSISGFAVRDKYVQIQNDCYKGVTVVDKKISSIEGVKASAFIGGNGLSNISIVTVENGAFIIRGRRYEISDDPDGVTFVTGSHGNVIEINGLEGSVEGDFTNEVSVNGKAVRLTGASSIKVTSDGENITEISNVAGDLAIADDKIYRKNIRVYELGGAEKLTTSAEGTIIFSGNKFEMSAGKTFELDEAGNISGIETAQSDDVVSAENVTEDFATITLSTTDNLEEVFGNFSEGLTVNGVFVKVTDSTNFVVKDDDENVYIETNAPDTFTINGKTFTTSADKTIFKLDASGNVCEIVSDSSLIEGDFNNEIIFNGQKFCVTGTNDTKISLNDETLITINLAKNSVEVVESGGDAEIALTGEGDITIGGKTFSTSGDFAGTLQTNSTGVYAADNFVGTISGELGGIELYGITITSDDNFNVTGDGEKITSIENLQNGSFTCDSLDGITINGSKVSVDNSDEITVTITDGESKITGLMNGANISNTDGKIKFVTDESGEYFVNGTILTAKANDTFIGTSDSAKIINARVEEILSTENARVISGKENVTLKGGEVVVVEDTSAKVNITASKGNDTIVSEGENVSVTFKGGKTEVFATDGKMNISGYNASTGSGFHTDYANIFDAINEGDIVFNKGRLTIGSALVIDGDGNNVMNFFDTTGELQKVGRAFTDTALNLSKETADLVLYADKDSTLTGGSGSDSIFAFEGSKVDAGAGNNYIYLEERGANADGVTILLNGKNTVENFNANFDGDKISVDAANYDFSFDGENISVKSGSARALLQNISSDDDAARILTLINGKEIKTAIAQEGLIIAAGNDTADIYVGKKSGVDFTGYNDSLAVDLSENFYGINCVTLGGGLNTLISSSQNETLTSSDGTTEFIFSKDSGRDVINNFNFDGDTISVGNETITAVNVNSAGGVRMEISGSASLTLEDAQGKNFRINNFVALVDKNLTYNAEANYFAATSQNATLTVGEGAEIWLDGSHGKIFSGDIRTLDATNSDGKNTLAGNDLDNTILAGNSDSSLWGGNGGNDFMQGGTGKNTFFYTNGNGNDTIQGANNGDVVNLAQVTLEQIASSNITADAVTLNFKDGGSLQINSAADITYQLADGSKFSANHEQSAWLTK